jgi:hypothetical protein
VAHRIRKIQFNVAQASSQIALRNSLSWFPQMFESGLQQVPALGRPGMVRQRHLLRRIGFKIEQVLSRGFEIQHEFMSRFSHGQYSTPATQLRTKRIRATGDALSYGRLTPGSPLMYLCPVALPFELTGDWQLGRIEQSRRKVKQAEGRFGYLPAFHFGHAKKKWNVN